jgi:Fur family ferric uptake transcriptional regulator
MQLNVKFRDKAKKLLEEHLVKKRLKSTRQRNIIFNEFFSYPGHHVTVEELYERVKRRSPKIGYATIYRTLRLFKDCDLAFERNFGDGRTRYEPVKFEGEHHDHLICIACGKITEFENQKIEHYTREVARQNTFMITNHKVELYGYCSSCKKKTKNAR